jgi:putative RNA 2'-phosphotransferase
LSQILGPHLTSNFGFPVYHGTAANTADVILEEGLKPMGRQYVHLSPDADTALEVGLRREASPVVLVVHAGAAYKEKVDFYQANESVWLADYVPATFISFFR